MKLDAEVVLLEDFKDKITTVPEQLAYRRKTDKR